jgi:hypothetical protein
MKLTTNNQVYQVTGTLQKIFMGWIVFIVARKIPNAEASCSGNGTLFYTESVSSFPVSSCSKVVVSASVVSRIPEELVLE